MTEPYAEYYRGFREAFHMANQIAAGGSRGMEDLTLKEVIRTLANYANGEARATPADHSKPSMTNGDFHCPACGEVKKGPLFCGNCLWQAQELTDSDAAPEIDKAIAATSPKGDGND